MPSIHPPMHRIHHLNLLFLRHIHFELSNLAVDGTVKYLLSECREQIQKYLQYSTVQYVQYFTLLYL